MISARWRAVLVFSLVFNAAVVGALVFGFTRQARLEREIGRLGSPAGRSPRGRHLLRSMDLPEEKRERAERIFDESQAETAALHDSLEAARGELYALLRAEAPDEGAIFAKIDEISSLQGELEKSVVRRLLRISEVLDTGERERFLRILQRRMLSGSRRHGRETERRPYREGGAK